MEDLKDRLNSDVEEVAADMEHLLERTRESSVTRVAVRFLNDTSSAMNGVRG